MKLKKGIAKALIGLGLSVMTIGTINININIDSQKFWDGVEKGELYVTDFNVKEYKKLRPELVRLMKEEQPAPGIKSLWIQTIHKEAKEDGTWEFKAEKGKTININSLEFIQMLNDRLEKEIKE